MTRIRVVCSDRVDQDVEAHLALLERLPRVALARDSRPVANQFALIARRATKIWRRDDTDIIVTAGEPALTAAMLAWRGPLVHLPVGALSVSEIRLLRWRAAATRLATVVSTHTAAVDGIRRGLDSDHIRVIRTMPAPHQMTRTQIRERLGIEHNAVCLTVCGRLLQIRGHALALWSAGVLAFRDPTWRVLIDPGAHDAYLARYAASTSRPGVTVPCGRCSASELAAAADAAIVDSDAVPSFVAIASAAACGVPIVAHAEMWKLEQLMDVPALLVADRKPRHWARAILHSVEGAQASGRDTLQRWAGSVGREQALVHQWLEIIHAVCGRKRSLVA